MAKPGSYHILPSACKSLSVNISDNIQASTVDCASNVIVSSIVTGAFDNNDSFYNCTFENNSYVLVQNNSRINIISPFGLPKISVKGKNSSATIGYILQVNVFEPYGYNSTSLFGSAPTDRVAGFGYLVPLIGGRIKLNESQLTPEPSFLPQLNETLHNISEVVPFGVYNQSQTQINYSKQNLSFGKVIGSKKFAVASYTVFDNRTVNYNPYKLVYSFFAYDQLIFFNLTINSDINLTPIYIQPLFPKFNFYTIPDNRTKNFTIKWLVAVPPQDYGWNFTTLLYRYTTNIAFTTNPIGAQLGPYSSLVKVLQVPNSSYSFVTVNGTRLYFINYTSNLPVGLNSSITMTMGSGEKNITYLQDSTTPSFGHGVSFCATIVNSSIIVSTVQYPGYYDFVHELLPFDNNSPVLVPQKCGIGLYVTGKNIYLNCNGGIINDQFMGIYFDGSRNVTINGCRIYGNGISFNNASNISILNTVIAPNSYNSSFAIRSIDSSNIYFYNVSVGTGYAENYQVENSTNIELSNISVQSKLPSTITTIAPVPAQSVNPAKIKEYDYLLYIASMFVASIYISLYLLSRRKSSKRRKIPK
ncbi:MAG: right-handed parallel beta-helix repeat-containing protein [Candidatus Micrarchaeia archaeon]